jgi:hypothetical protein
VAYTEFLNTGKVTTFHRKNKRVVVVHIDGVRRCLSPRTYGSFPRWYISTQNHGGMISIREN